MLGRLTAKSRPTAAEVGSGNRGSVTTTGANAVSSEIIRLTRYAREKNHMLKAASAVGKIFRYWRCRCNSDRRHDEKSSFHPPIHAPRHPSGKSWRLEHWRRKRLIRLWKVRGPLGSRLDRAAWNTGLEAQADGRDAAGTRGRLRARLQDRKSVV